MNILARSVLAGGASGVRSFTGLAGLVLSARSGAPRWPDASLARPWAKAGAALLAGQELVMDKLPKTPSRWRPAGLGSRLVGAAACGVVMARRDPPPVAELPSTTELEPAPAPAPAWATVVLTTATALATAFVGLRWRALAAGWFGSDLPGALIEDAVAVTLAWAAAAD